MHAHESAARALPKSARIAEISARCRRARTLLFAGSSVADKEPRMGKQAKAQQQESARGNKVSSPPAGQTKGEARTGERDENYDLISVLYHALQGADTIGTYLRDAQQADDEELTAFLEETRVAYVERANEAKRLLASRLEESLEDDEDDEDDEDEED
jgi:hypothetical protein